MVTVTSKELQEKKARHCYRGIVRDARRLRVTRQHLFYVLKGERRSPQLLRRYRELKGGAK